MQLVDKRYHYPLSQVFSPSLVKRLTDVDHERNISTLLRDCGLYPAEDEWDFSKGISIAYDYLKRHYRCEYIYKNEIANQLLLKYHKNNSATLVRELQSEQSIADIVIVNGNTVAYEIKTELDSFDRLKGQLKSYRSIFDYSYVVTYPNAVDNVLRKTDVATGIIVLNEKGKLKTVRKAQSCIEHFTPEKAVLSLRQSELVKFYEKWETTLPLMGSALIYPFCRNWYLSLDNNLARTIFSEALKSRRPSSDQYELVSKCNSSMKMLFLGTELSKKYCSAAKEKLGIFI